ncbi:MAG TPA: ABC transporter permease [Candidatus Angelobacter sp.]
MPIAAWTETLLKDLRYAARQFSRNPVFTLVAIASLAIGIGANTAIFSVMNVVMLKSLPVRDPQGLVMLTNSNVSGVSSGMTTGERNMITYPEFAQLRDHATSFSGLCAAQAEYSRGHARIAGGPSEEVLSRLVSEEYFSVLGVDPAIGRFFTASDAKSPGQDPYAVISYDFWQKRFGGNVSVLGTPIKMLDATLTVIGVAAPGFTGESVGDKPDFWIPMMMQPIVMPGRDWLHEDMSQSMAKVMWLHAFGRIKPGFTQARAQTEVDVLFRGIIENGYPATMPPEDRKQAMDQHIKIHDARTGAFGGRDDFAQQLKVLLGASAVVLLIACINVANLLLARATARTKEVGVRLSIGASRARLVRQFLTESMVLSLLGGAAGLLFAWIASRALVLLLSERREDFALAPSLDWRVLCFTVGVTLVTGILFGLAPALRGTRVNLNDSLRDSGRTTASSSKLNLAKGLVIVQVALSLLLVAGAGLFLRTLWNLQSVNLGFPKEHLLMISADGVTAGYKGPQLSNLWRDITERVRALPGVQGASYSGNGIFSGSESADEVDVEGFTPSKDNEKFSRMDAVGPQYFSTVGIPLLLGRELGQQDNAGSPHVCVINEAFAKLFFNGRNPIGRHITEKFGDKKNLMEIVGISKNARDHRLREDVPPRFYIPADQGLDGPNEFAVYEIRTAGAPEQMIDTVRKTILSVNEDLPVGHGRALVVSIDNTNAQPRMVARLCSIFGIMALLLASTGLYGVLSYGVARRTNEIGIRMALGAGRARVVNMILRETGVMVVMGVVAGVIFTAVGVQLIKSKLYGLGVLDPWAVLSAVVILSVVALIAGYIPAVRASRVSPTQALRHE